MKEKINLMLKQALEDKTVEIRKNPYSKELFYCYDKGLYGKPKTSSRTLNAVLSSVNFLLAFTAREKNEVRVYFAVKEVCKGTEDYSVSVLLNSETEGYPAFNWYQLSELEDTDNFLYVLFDNASRALYEDIRFCAQRRLLVEFFHLIQDLERKTCAITTSGVKCCT